MNQKELTRSFRVSEQAISQRLKVLGMIQIQGNWMV